MMTIGLTLLYNKGVECMLFLNRIGGDRQMSKDSFTVVSAILENDKPVRYICATDAGAILEYPVEGKRGMASLLKWHPEMVRNLTLRDLNPPYARFPTELNGAVAGTIVCTGVKGTDKMFRVVYKSDGVWCTEDFSEEETVSRIKKGLIAKAEVRGGKVISKAPINQALFATSDAVAEPKQLMNEKFKTSLLYVTEASDEKGNTLRYAGLEFTGSVPIIESMLTGFREQSVLFREAYFKAFGRKDEELALQTIPGKLFVVLPYQVAESLLLSGKRPVKITRVMVSAVAFRSGTIFDEAKVVISGVMGFGEIRGSVGSPSDKALRVLLDEVQEVFKQYTHVRAKLTN